ncbi:MAG: YgfZ/GcvT domain-containing protein [Terriglobales bacterium]
MKISPWLRRHGGEGAVEYRGAQLAGPAAGAALDAPFPAAALCDWSFRSALRVEGPEARKWLNGIITANVRDLAPGRTAPSLLLNPKGHILAMFDLAALASDAFLLLASEDQRTALLEGLRRFVFRSQLTITDIGAETVSLAVCGSAAEAALGRADFSALPTLGGWIAAEAPASKSAVHLFHWRLGQIETVEIFGTLNAVAAAYDALAAQAAPLSAAAWDRRLLLEGVPLFGRDIHTGTLPPEAGLMSAIGHNKGCYIGQEIVERIRARGQVHRQRLGFRFSGPVQAGERIRAGDGEAGELSATVALGSGPYSGLYAAVGYLRREAEESGAPLTAAGVPGEIAAFPLDSLAAVEGIRET